MNILITEPENYSVTALDLFKEIGSVLTDVTSRENLISTLPSVDILVLRLAYNIDADVLKYAARLKYIVTPTTGLNHIDLTLCEKMGIKVISLKGETDFLKNITPTAELTWGLLLSLVRNIPSACESVNNGDWDRDSYKGFELKDRTLGIIGYGRLGKMVAQYGAAFGMNVLFYDINEQAHPNYISSVSLDELLRNSDVISIHIPLNKANEKFVDSECIKKMKLGAVVINTSRGEVLCEDSLLSALKSGHIAGAALDVVSEEFYNKENAMSEYNLIKYANENNNLLITPHIGGACDDSMRKTEIYCASMLQKIVNNPI